MLAHGTGAIHVKKRKGSMIGLQGVRYLLAICFVNILTMLPQAPAFAYDVGTVTFTDDQNEVVVISRDFDPSTNRLTNTITVTRPDGTTETRTVSTTPDDNGGFLIDRTVTESDGRSARSAQHVSRGDANDGGSSVGNTSGGALNGGGFGGGGRSGSSRGGGSRAGGRGR